MSCRVINIHNSVYDTYIARPGKWGNPFEIGKDGTRKEVIEKYKIWIKSQTELINDLPELKDNVLGCFCKPKACHGDVLAEMVNKLDEPDLF